MWESLPPVASSSATPADQMTGVSVAVHTTGMLNTQNAAVTAPSATAILTSHPQSNAVPISQDFGVSGTNNTSSNSYNNSISRPPGASNVPVMTSVRPTAAATASARIATTTSPIVAAAAPPNSNPFATPREASLTSVSVAGGRDLSSRSSNIGASPTPQLFPPMIRTSQKLPSVDNNEVQSCNSIVPAAINSSTTGDNGLSACDYLPTPHASNIALPAPAHLSVLSSSSPPQSNYRLQPQPQQQSSSTAPGCSTLSVPPPLFTGSNTAVSDMGGRNGAQGGSTMAPTHSPLPLPPPTAASPTYRPAMRIADARTSLAVITRSVSPRHPHTTTTVTGGSSGNAVVDLLAQAGSPTNISASNGLWQSPGSISFSSAQLSNDPILLYSSSAMPEYAGGALPTGGGPSSYLGRNTISAARIAPLSPSVRCYRVNTTAINNSSKANNNNNLGLAVNATSGTTGIPTERLDSTSLHVDGNTSVTAGDNPPESRPLSCSPLIVVTPTRCTNAVPSIAVAPANRMVAAAAADGRLATSTSSSAGMQAATRSPPSGISSLPPQPPLPTTASSAISSGEASNGSSPTTANGISLTFVSPSFQIASEGLDESLLSNSLSGAPPLGLTAVARLPYTTQAGQIAGAPLPRTPQLPQSLSTSAPAVATATKTAETTTTTTMTPSKDNRTDTLAGCATTSAFACASYYAVTRAPGECASGTSDEVRVVGTESTTPPPQPAGLMPTAAVAATAATTTATNTAYLVPPNSTSVAGRETLGYVQRRNAVEPGTGGEAAAAAGVNGNGSGSLGGRTPPTELLTPEVNTAANAGGVVPLFSASLPHVAHATHAGRLVTPAQDPEAAGGRVFPQHHRHQQHHVSIAPQTFSPPLSYASSAQFHGGLPLPFTQVGSGGESHGTFHSGIAAAAADVSTFGGLDSSLHASLAQGSIDHNQSFYFGTTGNDNLRRSFFFPPSARLPLGEMREEGTASTAGDDVMNYSADLASYLLHPNTALHASLVELPGASFVGPSPTAGIAAAATVCTAAVPVRSASPAPSETTEGGDRYCSPMLYRVPPFPSISPFQPSMARLQPPVATLNDVVGVSMQAGRSGVGLPPQQQPQLHQQQQQSKFAPPPAGPYLSSPPHVTQIHLQRSLPEEPLRIGAGAGIHGRPDPLATAAIIANASVSASSSCTGSSTTVSAGGGNNNAAHRSGSTRVTTTGNSAESLHNFTTDTNQSFILPTLENSTLRRHFEASVASATEAIFALPENKAHAAGATAGGQVLSKNANSNSSVSPRASSGAVATNSSRFSPLHTPPKVGSSGDGGGSTTASVRKGAAGGTLLPITTMATSLSVGPAPAYILDWERSLIAFQNRAESYYTFKNLCTETYLTLIEHDVDRFLVCYYSGGTVKPEEAVQEALASRAGTPAATSALVLSSTSAGGDKNSSASRGCGGGGGLQKMIQTNKTLQRLSEAGSKWFTNFKKTAMTPVPVWGEAKTPAPSLSTATRVREISGRSVTGSAGSTATGVLPSTQSPQPLTTLNSSNGTIGAAAGEPSVDGVGDWWMSTETSAGQTSSYYQNNTSRSVEPTYSTADQSTAAKSEGNSTKVEQLLLDQPLSSSERSLATTSTLPDPLSTVSSTAAPAAAASGNIVSASKRAPISRLSYNIAAEEELQCLRQLGAYMANVIPETYMDARPSDQVLQHVRRNYSIILNALQHVLIMDGAESAAVDVVASSGAQMRTGRHVMREATHVLIAKRIRQGLLLPSIQATWRDYLSPLEMKVKELVQIATTNIDSILEELQSAPTDGIGATSAGGETCAAATADLEARQRLRALREQPVRRLTRLLRGDEEYLSTIHIMDDEFVENGDAWRGRSSTMRGAGAALSDYVPVYGLVLSRLHRLEIEHRTVLELWCGGV